MARIRDYTSQVEGPRPSGAAAEAYVQTGRANAVGGLGGTLTGIAEGGRKLGSAIEQRDEQSDITSVTEKAAEIQAAATQRLQDLKRTADPNDHEWANKFINEELTPQLNELSGVVKTRAGRELAKRHAATLKSQFATSAVTEQAELAGQGQVQSWLNTADHISSSIYNDPHNYAAAGMMIDDSLSRLSNVPVPDRLKMKRNLQGSAAEAYIKGLTNQGAYDEASKTLESGSLNDVLDAKDQDALRGHIEQAKRADAAEDRLAEAEARRQKTEQYGQREEQFYQQWVSNNADGTITVKPGAAKAWQQVMDGDPDAGRYKAGLSFIDSQARAPTSGPKDNQIVLNDMMGRLYLPATDPRKVSIAELNDAVSKRDLTMETHARLRREVTGAGDPVFQENMRAYQRMLAGLQPQITSATVLDIGKDPEGYQRWGEFNGMATKIGADAIRDGKTPEEAYAMAIGKIEPYRKASSINDQVNRITQGIQGNLPPVPGPVGLTARQPGESAADYLKRTGK